MTTATKQARAGKSSRRKQREGRIRKGSTKGLLERTAASQQQTASTTKMKTSKAGMEGNKNESSRARSSLRRGHRRAAFGEQQRHRFGEKLLHGGFLLGGQQAKLLGDGGREVAADVLALGACIGGGRRASGRRRAGLQGGSEFVVGHVREFRWLKD